MKDSGREWGRERGGEWQSKGSSCNVFAGNDLGSSAPRTCNFARNPIASSRSYFDFGFKSIFSTFSPFDWLLNFVIFSQEQLHFALIK